MADRLGQPPPVEPRPHYDSASLPPPPLAAPEMGVLRGQLDRGRPGHFPSHWHWLAASLRRQTPAAVVALLISWSGLWLVLISACFVVVIGSIVGLVSAFIAGSVGGITGIGIIVIGAVTAAAGFVASAVDQAPALIAGVVIGAVIVAVLLLLQVMTEPLLLRYQGYRVMSRREASRLIPLLQQAGMRMQLLQLPDVLMADGVRNMAAGTRHMLVGRTLYDEVSDEELAALLAHELHHWASGDALGLRLVHAAALPLVLTYNLLTFLGRGRSFLSVGVWLTLWPSWVLMHFVIEPLIQLPGRVHEYEADAAAKRAGYGPALRHCLESWRDFEAGGSGGWDGVILATHPPTELRIDALED